MDYYLHIPYTDLLKKQRPGRLDILWTDAAHQMRPENRPADPNRLGSPMARKKKMKTWIIVAAIAASVLAGGFLLPEELAVPVLGATRADWNPNAFWHPWGASGVHKGIDIFAKEGTEVIAAAPGIVLHAGTIALGGNVVSVLGPKWRIHYYAHLKEIRASRGQYVSRGDVIGTVGTTGNAAGKPPHLHYAIITQVPYVWLYRPERFGWERMFYLNPHEKLTAVK